MRIQIFDSLTEDARRIRQKVFIEEQGFCEEYDAFDHIAEHLVAYEQEEPAGTCRIMRKDSDREIFVLGRLAVLKQYRGKQVGAQLLWAAEQRVQSLGGAALWLHAQCRVRRFYEKQGYQIDGEVELEEGCPHIWMYKVLEDRKGRIDAREKDLRGKKRQADGLV